MGEVNDPGHVNEMAVEGWSWGMSTGNAMGAGRGTRTALSELRISRLVDRGSTALMSIMRNNDGIKKAVLSVRKASGAAPIDYFVVKIKDGRISSYEVSSSGPELTETITLAFEKIQIDYHSQSSSGGAMGSSTFETDVGNMA